MPLLDLATVKRQLNKSDTADDPLLTTYINAAAKVIERHTGKVPSPESFTEQLTVHDFGHRVRVTHKPLTAITALSIDDAVVDPSTVSFRPNGLIRFPYRVRGWIDVTYTAGLTTPPDNYELAGMIIVQHLWATTRGNMLSTNDPLNTPLEFRQPLAPYAIPNKALELLGPATPSVF